MTAFFSFEQADPEGVVHEFVFQLDDPAKIAEARSILSDPHPAKRHVMGTVIQSRVPYNSKWSFHLRPDSISFFEMAIEICDANVTYVEAHLDEVGGSFLPKSHWCPWSSLLKREIIGP
jgi:hypothetical protein